jgi:hypothetical protein
VPAAVTEAAVVADEHLAWAKTVCPLGQSVGGRTIHAPDVDRTPTAAIKTTVGVRLPPVSGSLAADALRGDG